MPSDVRTPETHVLFVGEAELVYCFDFTDDPLLTAGEDIAAPVTTADVARVTLGAPTVLTEDFVVVDRNGTETDRVAAFKGVKVAVTPGAVKGQCTVTCSVLASGGSRPGKQVVFQVK